MSPAVANLPKHLTKFIVSQNYSKYTPEEHATWRYIMRQNRAFFAKHAVGVYVEGLQKTGVPIDRIPNIVEMDECLSRFGYGAVGVVGFIPPAIFLEFQALGIMPIATDMRTLKHVGYTPAPDIVHEAAGHAPIVADPDYRAYLRHYGKIAHKALYSSEDIATYEAIRYLSDIKENPDTTAGQIAEAQRRLDLATAGISFVSESAKVGRMGWWTIEYGLVGTPKHPQIYGAGLLSSVAESQACLSPSVKKIPLDVHCVETAFDITEPQPQLFIAPALESLPGPLLDLEEMMSFRIGGIHGLREARRCKTICTVELDSGLQLGGIVEEFIDHSLECEWFKLSGACQLGFEGLELDGHGKDTHSHGYSSPLGRWRGLESKATYEASDDDFRRLGIEIGKHVRIEYTNRVIVNGRFIEKIRSPEGHLLMLRLDECRVYRGDRIFYQPDWGVFDLALGEKVKSLYSGPPDRDAYGSYEMGQASSSPGRQSPYSAQERRYFDCYAKLRELRQQHKSQGRIETDALAQLASQALTEMKDQWLISLECYELSRQALSDPYLQQKVLEPELKLHLLELSKNSPADLAKLISQGIDLADGRD